MQEQQNSKDTKKAAPAGKDASFVAAEAATHKIGHSPEENVANLNWAK